MAPSSSSARLAARTRVRLVAVDGDSMRPTVTPGDRLVVLPLRPRVGDVVALRDPRTGRTLVKRVASIVGDRVEVVGDNPARSTDSRTFGAVARADVLGRAVYRYAPTSRAGRIRSGARASPTLSSVEPVDLDRVLADDYVGDVTALDMADLRSKRAECQALEVGLSYVRRLAQGRLDLVAAEQRRRAEGGDPVDSDNLVESLSGILGDHLMAPGNGRLPRLLGPDLEDVDTGPLDEIAGPNRLTSLGDCADDELARLVERLSTYEGEVSSKRRSLHERIDALQAEITRRYKTGEASVESLLSEP